MVGTFWFLPLIVVAMYVLAVFARVLLHLTRENPDQYRCIAVLAAIAIAGLSPWLLLAPLQVPTRNSSPVDLYLHHWAEWPFLALHIWFAVISVTIGIWLIFWHGDEFLARYRAVFMVRPLTAPMARRFGWIFLGYPIVYFTALYVLNR